MERIDDSCFLLFIETRKRQKSWFPKNDEISKIMHLAMKEAKTGMSNYERINEKPKFNIGAKYRGFYVTVCGYASFNDYLLQNGMITHSLAEYYVRYYRKAIPSSELQKISQLVTYYKDKYKSNPEIYKNLKLGKIYNFYHERHKYEKIYNFILKILKNKNS